MRPRLHPERGARRRRARRRLELVRLRRAQRLDRAQASRRLSCSRHGGALGDVRLLRHADRLERRDSRASWPASSARARRRAARAVPRARAGAAGARGDAPVPRGDGAPLMEADSERRRAERECARRARCRAGSRFPRCAPRSKRRAHAAGSSRSSRTPTATSSSRRRSAIGVPVRARRRRVGDRLVQARRTGTGCASSRRPARRATGTCTLPQSHFHDIVPAHELGLRSIWINRHARAPLARADARASQPVGAAGDAR